MNGTIRGIRNTLRSPLRTAAIIVMIAMSVGLVLSMLAARGGINSKIKTVESRTANTITISPAGMQGGFGNASNPLTTANLTTVNATAHVASTAATLTDRLTNDAATNTDSGAASTSEGGTTSLQPSQTLGIFGARQMGEEGDNLNDNGLGQRRFTPVARITVTGTNSPNATVSNSQIEGGASYAGTSNANVAMVGNDLASENNLKVGDTFTAYGQPITVVATFKTGNKFQDNGLIMPLATVQKLSGQTDELSAITATVDSSSHVQAVVADLKKSLGSSADITSSADQAAALVQPLKSITSLALAGVIAATIAGGIIILLAMTIIVRERRREVGVMKAIGASNFSIIRQFSAEALTLTVFGGFIGIFIGLMVAAPITASLASSASSASTASQSNGAPSGYGGINRPAGAMMGRRGGGFGRGVTQQLKTNIGRIATDISPSVFGLSVILLLAIALIGSIVPAWLITKVKPAEILRNE